MAEMMMEDSGTMQSTTVGVYRTAATVKGGRRFSFSSLVVVGDRQGRIGLGYGKANQVPAAIEKAQKEARRKMRGYPVHGSTIPHTVTGRFGAAKVRLIPASPGTGIIAGAAVRAPLELLGIQDCLTKAYGSTNPKNLIKAVIDGLTQLRTKEMAQALRGVELEQTAVEAFLEKSKAALEAQMQKAPPARPKGPPAGAGERKPKKEPKPEADAAGPIAESPPLVEPGMPVEGKSAAEEAPAEPTAEPKAEPTNE